MKASFIFILIIWVLVSVAGGAELSILWRVAIPARDGVFNSLSAPDENGGFLAAGHVEEGDARVVLACLLSPSGEVEWSENFLVGASATVAGVERTGEDFIIAGTFGTGDDTGGFMIRIDAGGNLIWRRRFFPPGPGRLFGMRLTDEGNVLAVGSAETEKGLRNIWMLCIDPYGDLLWEAHHELPGNQSAHGVDVIPGLGFILAGSSNGNALTTITDREGRPLSRRIHDGEGIEMARGVRRTGEENFLVWGTANRKDEMPSSLFMLFDPELNLLWEKTWTTGGVEACWSGYPTEDGGYVFLCNYNSPDRVGFRSMLLGFDPRGEELWTLCIDMGRQTELRHMRATDDGGFLMAGTVEHECRSRAPAVIRIGPGPPPAVRSPE